jgi:hypothetical protein
MKNYLLAFVFCPQLILPIVAQTITPIAVCNLPAVVNESSGIEKTSPNSFWTHNDSGGQPAIYNYDSAGTLIKTINITNASNIDWEDVAFGDNNNFYIGDFGNNNNNRSVANGNQLRIYIIPNPDNIVGTATTATFLNFEYEDRNFSAPSGNHNFDMEGFFFCNDSLHLFTKNRTSPTNGWIKHYILPAQTGTYTAELLDSFNNTGIRITSADMSPDHKTISLLAQNRLYLISCFTNSRFFETGHVDSYTIPNTQKEAIVYDDHTHIYITDENTGGGTGNMYRVNLSNYIASPLNLTATVQPTCAGNTTGSILVNVTGGTPTLTYDWSTGGATNSITNLAGGSYFLTIEDNHGCLLDTNFTVNTSALPIINALNTGPYCLGETIELNSTGGFPTDDWTGPNSYLVNDTQSPTILSSVPSMAGIYTVVATNADGCSASATTTVVLNSLPIATALNTGPYCEGDTIQLLSSGGDATDDWIGPDFYTQNDTQDPFIINSTSIMAGVYTVTTTNVFGCSATSNTTVVLNALPVPIVESNSPLCLGDSILLTASGGIDFDWIGPNAYSQNNTQNPFITPSTLLNTGTYTVNVSDAAGCSQTATISVTVNSLPVTPTIIQSGDTLFAFPNSGFSYQWFMNGNIVPSAINEFFVVSLIGNYSVTIMDANGCSTSSSDFSYSNTSSMEEESILNKILVYPNPGNGIVNLTINNPMSNHFNIRVYDLLGRCLFNKTNNQNELQLDLTNLSSGQYHLIIDTEKEYYSIRIVIQ